MAAVDLFILLTVAVAINHTWSLQVIPERANVGNYNEKYVSGVKINVRRYSRRGNYYINFEGTIKHTWANNISVEFLFYEFLHNEYKRSFVQFEYKFCDLINNKPYIGGALRSAGITCPLSIGFHSVANLSIPTQSFPNVWPFEKSRLDVKLETLPNKDHVGDLHIYLSFKQRIGQ